MKPVITWILIADGARARILEHKGLGSGVAALKGMEFSAERLKSSEIMADKPGRAFASNGASRSAIEPKTDPVAKREADFMAMLAGVLNEKQTSAAFDRLVLIAAPRALGDLRKSLSEPVREIIYAELAKDLTKTPNDKIGKHLEEVMVV
ncbi:hypothetical protein MNBD_ALPHA12-2305 [hydrothermal vent metagenome]|uniref:Host attachment protein n=1 Tax=hydrothermal vent metagenome TaxID=652676 RepID=A0A3B0TQ10_9ZZZZ